jgi:kinesin family protein 12
MVKETGNINKSLFTLGKVIKGLSDRKSKTPYIPYRDSKLTMLLMDSLGGTSKALMIACASPSMAYIEETISTLNYATRTMNIKNKPVIQMDPKDQIIYGLIRERELLKLENQYLQDQIERGNHGIKLVMPDFMQDPKNAKDLPPLTKNSKQGS